MPVDALNAVNEAFDAYGQYDEAFADEFHPVELPEWVVLDMPALPYIEDAE
jgi:hypothetical protein